jgi:hypothetical protein
MTTITQKKKLSKSAYVLLGLGVVAIIAIIILATIGILDLSPVANFILSIYVAASENIVLAILIPVGVFVLGALTWYAVTKYFIGQKVTTAMQTYTPQGQTLSAPAKTDTETVIS